MIRVWYPTLFSFDGVRSASADSSALPQRAPALACGQVDLPFFAVHHDDRGLVAIERDRDIRDACLVTVRAVHDRAVHGAGDGARDRVSRLRPGHGHDDIAVGERARHLRRTDRPVLLDVSAPGDVLLAGSVPRAVRLFTSHSRDRHVAQAIDGCGPVVARDVTTDLALEVDARRAFLIVALLLDADRVVEGLCASAGERFTDAVSAA